MGQLSDIAKQRSAYLTLENGESIVVEYKGFKMVPSTFNPDQENYRFLLAVDINGEKQIKFWDTGSNKVAYAFDQVKEGDKVKISKSVYPGKNGKDQTFWEVEPMADTLGKVSKKTADEINAEMAG